MFDCTARTSLAGPLLYTRGGGEQYVPMAGLQTRGTVSSKVQYQERGMCRTNSSVSKKVLTLDCLNLNLVSPTDSGKNTVRLTQEGQNAERMWLSQKKVPLSVGSI